MSLLLRAYAWVQHATCQQQKMSPDPNACWSYFGMAVVVPSVMRSAVTPLRMPCSFCCSCQRSQRSPVKALELASLQCSKIDTVSACVMCLPVLSFSIESTTSALLL